MAGENDLLAVEYSSTIIRIVSWVLLVLAALFVGIKLVLTTARLRDLPPEDYAMIVAMIMDIAFTATLSVGAANGVGKDPGGLSPDENNLFDKTMYSSDIFFVTLLLASQLSVVFYLFVVSPVPAHRNFMKAITVYTCLCNSAFLLVALFPCSAPGVYLITQNQCIDQTAQWTAFYILNMIGEVFLIALPCYIMWGRSIRTTIKFIVVLSFGARALTLGALLASVVLLRAQHPTFDAAIRSLEYNMCRVVVATVAIITVCIPYVRTLFLGLQTGMLQTGRIRSVSQSDRITLRNDSNKHSQRHVESAAETSIGPGRNLSSPRTPEDDETSDEE